MIDVLYLIAYLTENKYKYNDRYLRMYTAIPKEFSALPVFLKINNVAC